MKLRKYAAAFAAAAALTVTAGSAVISALPAAAAPVINIQDQSGGSLVLNVWGGGNGAAVKMYSRGVANDGFNVFVLTGYCNAGRVSGSTACPFWNGSGWNNVLNGGAIVEFKSTVTGQCVGTDASGNANMGACPPSSGGTGSNIWVQAFSDTCNGSGLYDAVSVYWVNHNRNAYPNDDVLLGSGTIGVQAVVTGGPTDSGSCWKNVTP